MKSQFFANKVESFKMLGNLEKMNWTDLHSLKVSRAKKLVQKL